MHLHDAGIISCAPSRCRNFSLEAGPAVRGVSLEIHAVPWLDQRSEVCTARYMLSNSPLLNSPAYRLVNFWWYVAKPNCVFVD